MSRGLYLFDEKVDVTFVHNFYIVSHIFMFHFTILTYLADGLNQQRTISLNNGHRHLNYVDRESKARAKKIENIF